MIQEAANQQALKVEMALVNADLKYDREDFEDKIHIQLAFGGGEFTYSRLVVHVLIDEDGTTAHFTTSAITRTRNERFFELLECCNRCNARYRWVKFYIDDDGDVVADADATLRETCDGTECTEIVMRMADIVDETYEDFMRATWAD